MIEQLESRTLLAAWQPFASDPGESIAAAADIGSLGGVKKYSDSLSTGDRSDYIKFQVANRGNFNLTLSGLKGNADVELLNSSGSSLATSDEGGNKVERISRFLDSGTYYIHIYAGSGFKSTAYRMQLQADLNWGTIGSGDNRRNVGLVFSNDSTQPISKKKETWVLIHGWSAPGRPIALSRLAQAVDKVSKSDQVMLLDWSHAASTFNVFEAAMWAPDAAEFAADKLASWGIASSRINIIGHSLGGLVGDQLAVEINGGVNRLIALDAATSFPGVPALVDFAENSRYSLAFIGSNYSTPAAAATADEAFKVNVGPKDSIITHDSVVGLFASMVTSSTRKRPDAISKFFALKKLTLQNRPFKKDAFEGQYEGVIDGQQKNSSWLPKTLTYKNKAGKTVVVRA